MKNLLRTTILSAMLVFSATTVYAEEFYNNPTFYAENLISNEGLEENMNYLFEYRNVVVSPKDVLIMVEGEFIPETGIVKNGTTFVTLRGVSEALGQNVKWNSTTKEVTINDTVLTINSKTAKVGGVEKQLANAPFIEHSFTYVPLRFVAENFDKEVGYVSTDDETMQMDNSFVWIEEKNLMDNAGYTEDEVVNYVKDLFEVNLDLLAMHGNADYFTTESIANTKYVKQVGRYALLDTTYPTLVDMKNKAIYFNYNGNAFSGIFQKYEDGALLIGELGISFKLPEIFDDKYLIGEIHDGHDEYYEGFTVYHKASKEKLPEYGGMFDIYRLPPKYSQENPPRLAGTCYELLRTEEYVYMIQFPSGVEGYEGDEAIYKEYDELMTFATTQEEAMKNSIQLIGD